MRSLIFASLHAVLFSASILLNSPITYPDLTITQEKPIAVDDNYSLLVDCNCNALAGNLLENDIYDATSSVEIAYVIIPKVGTFTCDPKGNFVYTLEERFTGILEFRYRVQNCNDRNLFSDASIFIVVRYDSDCDHISDDKDIDCDNDGILDIHEGFGEIDTDQDGTPDCFDIDSDNDGITDMVEWQKETDQIQPSMKDENEDGWDDAFDSEFGGNYYPAVDTDMDGIPDFQDADSDDDSIDDIIEANVSDNNKVALYELSRLDDDHDGLDNVFDTIHCCVYQTQTVLSLSSLPDTDNDKIRNWRDNMDSVAPSNQQESEMMTDKPWIYPNPVQESCMVVIKNLEDFEEINLNFSLYSSEGKLVLQDQTQESSFQLNLNGLIPGIYFLTVDTGLKTYQTKIIKE